MLVTFVYYHTCDCPVCQSREGLVQSVRVSNLREVSLGASGKVCQSVYLCLCTIRNTYRMYHNPRFNNLMYKMYKGRVNTYKYDIFMT